MTLPLQKRDFDFFLSHAHVDRAFVTQLHAWLTNQAGLSIWYDQQEMAGGSRLATSLQAAIARCRGALLVATDESLKRGWVLDEYNAAMDERANQPGFRVVALRIANADPVGLLRGTTWIDMPEAHLDRDTALSIIRACYPGDQGPIPKSARDVFISGSWRAEDSVSARAVCGALVGQGFRLIGDARDQKGFGEGDRVRRIIASCGVFVGIVPFRGAETASREDGEYKYFVREMDLAQEAGLPGVIVADPRVRRIDGPHDAWHPMDTNAAECPPAVTRALEALWDQWAPPTSPHYVFLALDVASETARAADPLRHMIERITGMPSVVGSEIREEPLPKTIIRSICDAFAVVADVTNDNLNTCIEAGMAIAAGRPVELFAKGKPRRPPFMLPSLQLATYEDEVDQVGILHRILRPYRRRVINAEL